MAIDTLELVLIFVVVVVTVEGENVGAEVVATPIRRQLLQNVVAGVFRWDMDERILSSESQSLSSF